MMTKTIHIGPYCVFKDRASTLWVVRDRDTGKDVAHENNKRNAVIVAKCTLKKV